MNSRVSVIGIGRMGAALAGAFLRQGHFVTIWNRTRSKCGPLEALGATVAPSVSAAVAASEVIVVNVLDYGASDLLIRKPEVAAALRGKLLVELSSSSPKQARARLAWAREAGIDFLDGAIMATPDFIGQEGCTILYAGASALFERHKPCLLALGSNPQHVSDDVGHASALDSALLMGMWGELFGVLQGAAICAAEQVPVSRYARLFAAIHPVVESGVADMLQRIEAQKFAADEHTLSALDAHDGAFQHVRALCAEHGLNRAVPEAFEQLFAAARAAGHAQDDFSVLSKFMR
jgi:3-hydroxyisobutyrate dehydrogenase-like beta-hydroxyacid dehydrogenase